VLVSTIRFLESLPAKSPNEKSQFLRGLQRVLPEFPVSVLERKLLGALMDELKDRELLALILQNVFGILRRIPSGRRVFPEKIIPRLKEVFGTDSGKTERDSKKDAGLMVVLENMKLVADNCSGMEFKDGKFSGSLHRYPSLTFARYSTPDPPWSGFAHALSGRCCDQMSPHRASSSRL
jgi:SCY1-like protein 2